MKDITEFPLYKDIHGMVEIAVDNLGPWISFIGSLEERTKHITASADGEGHGGQKWIYRGQADARWSVASSFEREYLEWFSQFSDAEGLLKSHELSMIERFRQKACGYVEHPDMSNLEWLALMRHYGVPTRFVDFSESPFVSLYFASLDEAKSEGSDFAIWAVERDNQHNCYAESKDAEGNLYLRKIAQKYPRDELNKVINDRNSKDPDVQAFQRCSNLACSSALNRYQVVEANRKGAECVITNVDKVTQYKSKILVVYPRLPNSRMRAQSGLLLMPTRLSVPFMESLYEWTGCPLSKRDNKITIEEALDKDMTYALLSQCCILKFVFPSSLRKEVRAVLNMANVNAQTISPDLEGVAALVKCEYRRKDIEVYRNPISISVG